MPFVNLHSSMESVRLGHVWSDDSDDDSEDSDGIEISTEDMDRNELFELVLQVRISVKKHISTHS